jgi:uncharacterized membrane protein (UPF0182 family)
MLLAMRDLFDEFLEELRRRQAAANGRPDPRSRRPPGGPDDGAPDEGPDGEEPNADRADADRPAADEADSDRADMAGTGRAGPGPSVTGAGRGGRRPPTRARGDRRGLPIGRIVIVVVIALIIVAPFVLDLWTDAIWYRSIGFDPVFWTRIGTQFWLFAGALVLALVALLGNVLLARRLARASPGDAGRLGSLAERLSGGIEARGRAFDPYDRRFGSGRPSGPFGRGPGSFPAAEELPNLWPFAGVALVIVVVLVALGVAGAASGGWETFLLWRNQVPFAPNGAPAVTDPVFGRDIGFYLFELPFLRFVQGLANSIVLASLLAAAAWYAIAAMRDGLTVATSIRVHLAVLAGLLLLSIAAGYQLDKYELVYSTAGVATGVSYTDAAARFLALNVLTAVAALAAALLVGGAFTRYVWPVGGAIVVWLGASLVLGTIYPALVQRFVVAPNPFDKEQPYIGYNISMTRLAYGLSQWSAPVPYDGTAPLTQQQIDQDSATFQNARLWDYRPLGTTLDQLQTVRQYYDFVDVDTDRYELNGQLRQVMLSGRELAVDKIPSASNWLNERIIYTHGIGLAMVPVNEVTPQGQPRLIISNLPPVSTDGAPPVTQPRIYFGTRASDWVVTGARQDEFDYPAGGGVSALPGASSPPAAPGSAAPGASIGPTAQPSPITVVGSEAGAETRWTGDTGIKIDSTLTRLLFAARFQDVNLLISDQITNQSQILLHQTLSDRLPRIAPFLRYDSDPYLVVRANGRLAWIQDAYTVSDRFPNAEPFDPTTLPGTSGLGSDPINYLRNSVKVVIDAYDGTTTFYAADPNDPILRAYEGVFPTLFHPLSSMPDDLRAHIRYPEELFNVQSQMYGRYHVTDPFTFFSRDDLWTIPAASTNQQNLPPEAYYVVMRLPDQPNPEFLLLQPMIPASRPNMIAWVAARSDGANYGAVRVYHFPSDSTVLGPTQIEALIDQDPIISAQVTLWNQAGSTVVRGNLIVVPVANSLIYLQPVYLQSTGSAFPQFQRIVVATPGRIVWGSTLTEALNLLLAQGPGTSPTPSPSPSPGAPPTPAPSGSASPGLPSDVSALIAYANAHFEAAQAALRAGDFARYGQEIELVQQALTRLQQLTGATIAPSVAPSAIPGGASPSP